MVHRVQTGAPDHSDDERAAAVEQTPHALVTLDHKVQCPRPPRIPHSRDNIPVCRWRGRAHLHRLRVRVKIAGDRAAAGRGQRGAIDAVGGIAAVAALAEIVQRAVVQDDRVLLLPVFSTNWLSSVSNVRLRNSAMLSSRLCRWGPVICRGVKRAGGMWKTWEVNVNRKRLPGPCPLVTVPVRRSLPTLTEIRNVVCRHISSLRVAMATPDLLLIFAS